MVSVADMPMDGSLSYRLGSSQNTRVLPIDDTWKVKIERLDEFIARLCFLNAADEEQSMAPEGFVLLKLDSRDVAPSVGGSFLLNWSSSYDLFFNDAIVLCIRNQRQQSLQRMRC